MAAVSLLNWRWLFYLNSPLTGIVMIIVAMFVNLNVLKGTMRDKLCRMDWTGNAIFILAITYVAYRKSFSALTMHYPQPTYYRSRRGWPIFSLEGRSCFRTSNHWCGWPCFVVHSRTVLHETSRGALQTADKPDDAGRIFHDIHSQWNCSMSVLLLVRPSSFHYYMN